MRAKKSLGQHFLRSDKALNTIIQTGEINIGETVLEIGPGEGALTEKLIASGAEVIAVEKDDELFEFLKAKFKNEIEGGQLELIHDDILKFNENSKLEIENYKLIANIPYNITGAIFKKFLSSNNQPSRMVLLVQKEVAQRIVARDGKESILSISVKAYGEPRYIEKVPAGAFAPAPKVDSAIIEIAHISKIFFKNIGEEAFFRMVRAGFQSKRKKLASNLASIYSKESVLGAFMKTGLDENSRAEDISVENWQKLAISLL